jgi:hypothetical protein
MLQRMRSLLPEKVNTKLTETGKFFTSLPKTDLMLSLTNSGFLAMKVKESTEKLADYGGKSAIMIDQKVSKLFSDTSSVESNIDATHVDFVEVTIQDLKEFTQEVSQEIVDGALSGVEKASLKFLDLTFREPDVHRAILDVLKASLNEKEFIKESRTFGIDLINEAIKDENFKMCLKQSSLKIVRDEIVKNASIDLIKF